MLRERLLVGIIGGIFAIMLLIFGSELLLGAIISVIALMGLTEIYGALGYFKKNIPLAVIGYIGAVVLILPANVIHATADVQNYFIPAIAIFIIALLIYMVLSHRKTSYDNVSACFFSTLYVILFFSHLIFIRKMEDGIYLIWLPIIIAWLSDTMAYAFGRLFGKHKLIPEVSPKKTVEGAVGGVVGSILFMMIYGVVCKNAFGLHINWLNIVVISVVGSIISQFGDLAASWIKREKGIKDYGDLLPGHGGVMDRFDSVLFVAPFVYYLIMILPVF